MADIVCFGDLLIDFVPTESGLDFADLPTFKPAPGGAAANVAVGLAKLGVPSAFIGKVGDEAFGQLLVDTLRREGVDVGSIRLDQRARTALAFVTLTADGERDFLFYRHPSPICCSRPTKSTWRRSTRPGFFTSTRSALLQGNQEKPPCSRPIMRQAPAS